MRFSDGGARIPVALLAAVFVAFAFSRTDATSGQAKTQPPPKKNPLLKLAEPWPEAEVLRTRRVKAESLPLFASDTPIAITITADFKLVNKDRDPNSTQRFPAVLQLADAAAKPIPVKLGTRGHFRLMPRNCEFVPLRVEFPEEETKGTVFEGQSWLKLGTHCQDNRDYEQYTLKEYLTYKVFNLLTPKSFRARLVKATYIDSKNGKQVANRYGLFLEHESDLARRMEGRAVGLQRVVFKDLDPETLTRMMVFQYMIGNTDFSIYVQHNVRLVQTPDRKLYSVPYDFDISGLVHPPYAIPARGLIIKSVLERLYRGPCRTAEEIDPVLAGFREKKDDVLKLYDSLQDLNRESKQEAKDYLDDFYSTIKNPGSVKRLFIEGCPKKNEGM